MIKRLLLLLSVSLLISACSDSGQQTQSNKATFTPEAKTTKVLRVGFPPDENPQEIIRKNKPLLEYLRQKTGLEKVEIVVPDTYTAAVEQMAEGKLDMVYFGGLTYVLAKKDVDITPIVRGKVGGTPENFTFIVVRKDSGIDSLDKLKGRTLAFGDVASTSGHLIPHKALLNKGISPNKDMAKVVYTGAHDKTALAVFNKEVDAGAMNARKFPSMVEKGQIDGEQMYVLWKSEPFADYPWAVKTDLGSELIGKIQKAFVELSDPEMLSLLGVEGYSPTTDADFESIRQAALDLGFFNKE